MKNEEIKKAFDFELENTNEPLYSDEILKFVKNFHKKTKIEKEKFINSYQNNILDVISEIDFAFNDLLSNCKDAENRLYTIEELTPKNIKKREKLIKEIELLNNSKTQWNNDLKYFIKIGIQETKEPEVKESVLEPKKFLFINEFDKVNEDLIYKHFYENLVDKGYLTNKELETFLIEAFNKKNIPSIKFDFKNIPNKKTIINIFYTYFMLAQKPHGKKPQYVKLLTDYFNGYEYNNTLTNFAKHYY